jgi:uncharacterized protein YodC (DUF2158 family)
VLSTSKQEKLMAHHFPRRSLVRSKDNPGRTMWIADNNEDGSWGEGKVNCEWRDQEGQLRTTLFAVDEIEPHPDASAQALPNEPG